MLENKEVDYVDALHQLEIVDNLQRLGVSYHFEDEIKRFLSRIYNERNSRSSYHAKEKQESSLYAVALEFRLLRQHGFDMHAQGTYPNPMEVFVLSKYMCVCDSDVLL